MPQSSESLPSGISFPIPKFHNQTVAKFINHVMVSRAKKPLRNASSTAPSTVFEERGNSGSGGSVSTPLWKPSRRWWK